MCFESAIGLRAPVEPLGANAVGVFDHYKKFPAVIAKQKIFPETFVSTII